MISGGPGLLAGTLAGAIAVALEKALAPGMKDSVEVFSDEAEDTVTVRILADGLLFRPGRAELLPALLPALDEVARELRKRHGPVRVEGHTCDLPTANAQFASNWELSAQRAVNVLHYLVGAKGLAAPRFSAAAYAATRPVAPNNGEANRRRNRRVDLVLLNVSSDEPPPLSGESPAPAPVPAPPVAPAPPPAPPPGLVGPLPVVVPPPQIVPPIRIAP
jgi:outer membrane protein OmpA-like peptidoglycan-associated protein